MMSKEEVAANMTIQVAHTMIGDLDYQGAKAKIQEAIDVFPTIQYAKEMILICEILHLRETQKYFQKKTFPYSILQIPTSSTESDVFSRYVKLIADLEAFQIEGPFSLTVTKAAINALKFAMCCYKEGYLDQEREAELFYGTLVRFDWDEVKKIKTPKDKIAAKNAVKAMVDAKSLISDKEDFKSAVAKVEEAIKLFPEINLGKEMLNVCNLLYNFNKYKQSSGKIWHFVLQIPSSSTKSEVQARFKEITDATGKLCQYQKAIRFPGLSFACEAVRQASASFERCKAANEGSSPKLDKKRKASCKDATAISAPAATANDTEMEMMSNIDEAYKSPEFKKLCKKTFHGFSQDPHFNPLSIYSSSTIIEDMKSVLDARFVKLTQKLFKSGDNLELLLTDEEEATIRAELKDLKSHGYNVKALKERVDLIARIGTLAKQRDDCEYKVKELEGQSDKGSMSHFLTKKEESSD